ncbi:MAG TPA: CoB--CoM heterodisulfide reductase subunit C [Candidatus Lokiarchaeia archaeon]|nr:CoB--CoM heterodisulfide reductase subunit C [Candidatus Lokiarchaeia archaeon]
MFYKQIGLKGLNPRMLNQLLKTSEDMKKIKACMQCGECSASCPSGRFTAMRTRKLVHSALLGVESVLQSPELWMCTTCYRCLERCPRRVPVTDVIISLRNIAALEGYIQESMKNTIKILEKTGHGVPLGDIDSAYAKQRTALGLSTLPPTVHSYPEALEEIKKLFEISKFKERISLEW